jgi:uncharacterized membrane protein YwzB
MGKQTIIGKIKHLVYIVILPIYLWSIGYKTLDEYIKEIELQHDVEESLKKRILE